MRPVCCKRLPFSQLALSAAITLAFDSQIASAQPTAEQPASTQQSQQALEPVTVRATREEVTARISAPNPVIVLSRTEIEKTNDLTVGDFLRRQPGISFSGPAGYIADIRMRGLDKGYTQILIDGEPWLAVTKERQVQVDQLPMSMVERVEIIRSPLSDIPADGVGGTINIILRQSPQPELDFRLGAGAIWQSGEPLPVGSFNLNYAQYWTNGLSVALPFNFNRRTKVKYKPKIIEAFNATTGVRTALSEEFEDEDTAIRETSFSPRLVWRAGGGNTYSISAFYNLSAEQKNKPVTRFLSLNPASGNGFVSNGSSDESELKDRLTQRINAQWQRKWNEGLSSRVGILLQKSSEDKDKDKRTLNALGTQTSAETEDATVDASSYKILGHLNWSIAPSHDLSFGLELQNDDRDDLKLKTANGIAQVPGRTDKFSIDESKASLYVRDNWRIAPNHFLVSGLRYERRLTSSIDGAGRERSGSNQSFNPSVSYRWTFAPDWQLRAALAQTLRAPKFENLTAVTTSSSGINSPTNPDVGGNPDLKAELSRGLDLSVETSFYGRNGFAALHFSQRFINDKVENLTQLEGSRWVQRPYNVPGTSITRSFEIDGRFDLRAIGYRQIAALANYSRFQSKQATTNQPLKDQPKYVFNVGMDWRIAAAQLLLGWRYNFQSEILKNSGETESPQRLLDAFAYWTIAPRWSLRLSASNLLDTKKTKYKPTFNSSGVLTGLTREQERSGRGALLTLEGRL